ncbi:MAG: hypothetical protein ACLSFV_24560 [Bacteroides xylanisolvens]
MTRFIGEKVEIILYYGHLSTFYPACLSCSCQMNDDDGYYQEAAVDADSSTDPLLFLRKPYQESRKRN